MWQSERVASWDASLDGCFTTLMLRLRLLHPLHESRSSSKTYLHFPGCSVTVPTENTTTLYFVDCAGAAVVGDPARYCTALNLFS